MPLVVYLKNANKPLVISTKWFEKENNTEFINNGLVYENYIQRKIFYSPNKNDEPNFELRLKNKFEEDKPGCYSAYIIKYFSKCFLLFLFGFFIHQFIIIDKIKI